jgi:ATP-dependent helicase/nuclease subunit A
MVSVSELKKQSQAGISEEALGTGREMMEGETLFSSQPCEDEKAQAASEPGKSSGGALRGTAYHRALECLDFAAIHSFQETKEALRALYDEGYLTKEAFEWVSPFKIWKFMESNLGRRMAAAAAAGRLHKEQQFMIGIPAREMGRGESDELVLIQGIIDAYMEEEDGLVLVDYKTDRVSGEKLAELYHVQLEYYEKALSQLTGKKVREKIIYSLTLQEEIRLK